MGESEVGEDVVHVHGELLLASGARSGGARCDSRCVLGNCCLLLVLLLLVLVLLVFLLLVLLLLVLVLIRFGLSVLLLFPLGGVRTVSAGALIVVVVVAILIPFLFFVRSRVRSVVLFPFTLDSLPLIV